MNPRSRACLFLLCGFVTTLSYTFREGQQSVASETGFGPPRTVEVKPVKREIDPPHEFVAIRFAR